jgi:hypothetical protein
MKNNNDVTLTKEQLQIVNTLFKALETLSNDRSFQKKLEIAYNMSDEDVNETNEDDYMKLINFKEDVIDYTNNSFR